MTTRIILPESEIPQRWYNIQADIKPCPPPIHPGTKKPLQPSDLEPIFPKALIEQEMTREKWIEIPDEVLDIYRLWRPTPLVRAFKLEKALKTPARIYYKNESVSPPGSHKANTSVAQVYYNKKEGVSRIATETGAGQWGSALSFACDIFGLKATVYMVKVSYEQKPYRKFLMRIYGAEIFPSPSRKTKAGTMVLEKDPKSPGSLGIAISEAVEDAATHEDTKYALGSVLNHVLLHQSVIGLELKKQMILAGDEPDYLIGCVGGGSNFAGLIFPYVPDKLKGKDIKFIAVEPTACPTLSKGEYRYDFGDTAQLTPLIKMFTLGHNFVPPGIHAGGLRYHGMAPLLSAVVKDNLVDVVAVGQTSVFEAGVLFARSEGIVPAPESAHAVRAAIDIALQCKEKKEEKAIVFELSGHGHFDLSSYEKYIEGSLSDYEYPDSAIRMALSELPEI